MKADKQDIQRMIAKTQLWIEDLSGRNFSMYTQDGDSAVEELLAKLGEDIDQILKTDGAARLGAVVNTLEDFFADYFVQAQTPGLEEMRDTAVTDGVINTVKRLMNAIRVPEGLVTAVYDQER